MAVSPHQLAPGQLFRVPGYTTYTEQEDSSDGITQTLSQTNSTPLNGLMPFKNTDIVLGWEARFTLAQTNSAGSSTVTQSPYWPFTSVGNVRVSMQSLFDSINTSGINLAILQMYRGFRNGGGFYDALDTNAVGLGNNTTGNQQSNIISNAAQTSSQFTTSQVGFILNLPVSILFDVYYDMSSDGNVYGQYDPQSQALLQASPMRSWVTPQYMAGVRSVLPYINFNPLSSGLLDGSLYNIGSGTGTASAVATLNIRRLGFYSEANVAQTPPVYNWDYSVKTQRFAMNGVSTLTIYPQFTGQILSIIIRAFDPAANGGLGAPIDLNGTIVAGSGNGVLKHITVSSGSGTIRYSDYPADVLARFVRQHKVLPPTGVVIYDFATDEFGRTTNADALNTMTTSGIQLKVDLNSTTSASAYAEVTIEGLQYVDRSSL